MKEGEQRRVVCFMQPNFTDVLKRKAETEQKVFSVTTFDDCDTFHVRVECIDKSIQREPEKRVAFKLFKELPQPTELQQIASSLVNSLADLNEPQIAILFSEDDHVRAYVRPNSDKPVEQATVLCQPSTSQLYSRSRGILESSLLKDRRVAVVGLGSGGSHVVIELAKAGVGKFTLVDYDRIELQNIIRHICGLTDLGRLKTNAMRDRILEKNPFAEVKELGIPALYGSCAVRAAGGQVVRVRPNVGPCFSCIYVDAAMEAIQEEMSSFHQAREAQPPYVGDDEVEATIQVGLSSDIVPIANMLVKLALVELCRGKDSALATLEKDLEASFYMWANRREQQYAGYTADSFHRFDEPGILRWYPMRSERRPDCKICQNMEGSAENREFFLLLKDYIHMSIFLLIQMSVNVTLLRTPGGLNIHG
ncbi:hypothetical protein OS493_009918 [Desmophyllum pertusum]|uniref:THIF-type NAD/FAD binding fold domain-containing protein n=1 Tax=Desmophyllum pertusum TaxID=174260 RepID=A0A9W9YE86_9CNID|nr:hypothetical protein OS493_009918 [Desmophyllum pertusum]